MSSSFSISTEGAQWFERKLEESLHGETPLKKAMSYSLLGSGKRLRPWLVFESAYFACNGLSQKQAFELALPAALAVEYVHCYSLVHDDLPSMDNDDYRRGKLACHKMFDESTAILVGDALLSDAFEILADAKFQAAKMCGVLARSIGSKGMVLGQTLDLSSKIEGESSVESLFEIYKLKTGRLFSSACQMGALSVDASMEAQQMLASFGQDFGDCFQLFDDFSDKDSLVNSEGSVKLKDKIVRKLRESTDKIEACSPRSERLASFVNRFVL